MGLETTFETKNKVSNTFRLVLFDEETPASHPTNYNTTTARTTTVTATAKEPISEEKLVRLRRSLKTSDFSEYDKVCQFFLGFCGLKCIFK